MRTFECIESSDFSSQRFIIEAVDKQDALEQCEMWNATLLWEIIK